MEKENTLLTTRHILICLEEQLLNLEPQYRDELEYVKRNFCGTVFKDMNKFNMCHFSPDVLIYMCGDIERNVNDCKNLNGNNIFVIKEFSNDYKQGSDRYRMIDLGGVPINVHGVGVYFRGMFNSGKDYFKLIEAEHKFQNLTESNKPGQAFRTGIYLTKVEEQNDEVKFKLLRCSSNFSGPTDNFRSTDNEVVSQVNGISRFFFAEKTELNHVLAQIYENHVVESDDKRTEKEKKAKIKKHSDKTKDMPRNGLMAFCTFYKDYSNDKNIQKSKTDPFDYCYKDVSVLTTLRFELKNTVNDPNLKRKFDVTLYPNSVFIMSLDANRLYTHEIVPSKMSVYRLPTRLGYVIRCSKTDAVHKDGNTYIVNNGSYVKLEEPDKVGVNRLKDLYFRENTTHDLITYDGFNFSLNKGDYVRPIV